MHAEKDVNTYTKNYWKNHILHDRHDTIENFTYLETKGETHETLRGPRKTELHANNNITVHGESHAAIDDKWLVKVGNEVHIKAGMKVVLEAGAELTVKAGGQWIKLDPSGIKTSPVLKVGTGSPGNGSGAAPEVPEGSAGVEKGIAPSKISPVRFVAAMKAAHKNAQPLCSICETETTV